MKVALIPSGLNQQSLKNSTSADSGLNHNIKIN